MVEFSFMNLVVVGLNPVAVIIGGCFAIHIQKCNLQSFSIPIVNGYVGIKII